jgi:predicted nucleotidyltransferase
MQEKKQILQGLKEHLKRYIGDNLNDIILFGSRASNNENEYSDYDILILLKEKPDWKLRRLISDSCYEIDLKYGIVTDTHVLSIPELNTLRGKQPFFQNAISNGIYA